jgi:outer membrane protein OmpA-like peptidoglycan-associated protein
MHFGSVSRHFNALKDRKMKLITPLIAAFALAGCSMPKPPTVSGDSRTPVNGAQATAAIENKAQELQERESRIARERAEAAAGKRPAVPASYTVNLEFASGSSRLSIPPGDDQQIRAHLASAKRVEVRGRTDGLGHDATNARLAHERAQSVKDWIVFTGYPSTRVDVSYRPTGDYIARRDREPNRGDNRRVEIEFFN